MTNNNLIERYVQAVGNQLNGPQREDIQLELRSTLHDMLEERGLDADQAANEEEIVAMLKEFGSPHEIANSYRPQRFLIGPRYYPIYAQVMKIVATIMLGVVTLGTLLGGLESQEFWQQFMEVLGNYLSALWSSLGIVTFIFFAVERSGIADEDIEAEWSGYEKDWDPRKLPDIKDADRVDYFELVVELLFTLAALVLLNSAFGVIGPVSEYVSHLEWLPELIAAFAAWIPWLLGLFALEIILKFYVLIRGRWQRWTRWFEFAITVPYAVGIAWILTQAPFSQLVWLDVGIKISLVVALLITAGLAIGQLYRLLWPERKAPWNLAGVINRR